MQRAKTPSQWRWASTPAHSEKQHRPGWDPTQSLWALLRGGGVGQGGTLTLSAMETRRSRDNGSVLFSTFSFRFLSDQEEIRRKSDWPPALLVFTILFVLGTFHSACFQVRIQIYLPCRSSLGSFSVQFHGSDSENFSDNCFFIVSVPHTFLWELTPCFLVTSHLSNLIWFHEVFPQVHQICLRCIKSAFTDLSCESLRFCRF